MDTQDGQEGEAGMDFMAGAGMTPEKEEALLELARLCESQASSAEALGRIAAEVASELEAIAARAAESAEERKATAAAVRARAEGAENAALADAANGNWEALKIADRMSGFGWVAETAAAYRERVDADQANVSDILYHLTN